MSHNRSKGEVPDAAALALAERRFYSEHDGGVFDHLGGALKATLVAAARRDLKAALPALRTQLDQEWEERLQTDPSSGLMKGEADIDAERGRQQKRADKAEERLKEVERQRDELAAENPEAAVVQAYLIRAQKAEHALANSQAQVRLLRERSGPRAVEEALSRRDEQVRDLLDA